MLCSVKYSVQYNSSLKSFTQFLIQRMFFALNKKTHCTIVATKSIIIYKNNFLILISMKSVAQHYSASAFVKPHRVCNQIFPLHENLSSYSKENKCLHQYLQLTPKKQMQRCFFKKKNLKKSCVTLVGRWFNPIASLLGSQYLGRETLLLSSGSQWRMSSMFWTNFSFVFFLHEPLITFLPTVSLSKPTLKVIPDLEEISEGDHLHLICSVEGTLPVTFRWYRSDKESPLHVVTTDRNNVNYQIPVLSREDSGRYRCEAVNPANNTVCSDFIDIKGKKVTLRDLTKFTKI